MKLEAYLDRIGYKGAVRPDAETLRALHKAHVTTIPYENLDVQFGRPVSRDPAAAFDKIVTRRRGGWCYEMNGLLGWALDEIGFKVKRLAGGVERASRGDAFVGNHLVLIVDLEKRWLVDAGFGDGLIEAIPLQMGAFQNGPYLCRIERIEDGWLRYHNDPRTDGPTFDFHLDIDDDESLERNCRFLQTSEMSPFVQNAVVQRWEENQHLSLRGRVLTALGEGDKQTRLIEDADDYVQTLKQRFLLDLPDAGELWEKICARHETVFADETAR